MVTHAAAEPDRSDPQRQKQQPRDLGLAMGAGVHAGEYELHDGKVAGLRRE
jgi:hypothetical protein